MKMLIKECERCAKDFETDPRVGNDQRVCALEICQRWRAAQAKRHWRQCNRDYYAGPERRQGMRAWAEARGYWADYRRKHPEVAERNRAATRERMRQRRALFAKQDTIRRDPVGYLKELHAGVLFAKQDTIAGCIEGVLTYLETPGLFAKQDAIDANAGVNG